MRRAYSCWAGLSGPSIPIICTRPSIIVSGRRRSWLTVCTNSDFSSSSCAEGGHVLQNAHLPDPRPVRAAHAAHDALQPPALGSGKFEAARLDRAFHQEGQQVRLGDALRDRAAGAEEVGAQHRFRGGIGVLDPVLRIHDQHAFRHRVEDGGQPAAFVFGALEQARVGDRQRRLIGKPRQEDRAFPLRMPAARGIPRTTRRTDTERPRSGR